MGEWKFYCSVSGSSRLSACPSACICLNIACTVLSSFDLLFSKVWEQLDSQLPKETLSLSNRTIFGDGVLRPKTASCSKTVGKKFTAHDDSRGCRLCTLYHNINSRLMV